MGQQEVILVANRGEIAARILRAAQDCGIKGLALTSEDEPDAPWTRYADDVLTLNGRGMQAWLDKEQITDKAKTAGATMIHPGYGMLSENAAFADLVTKTGMTFIGPSPACLTLFGDKGAAIALAKRCKVPVIPGCPAPATAGEIADLFEYLPDNSALMIKACMGGGGRGMRLVTKREAVESACQEASGEAMAAFGDNRIYAEMRIDNARHIEVQILADQAGNITHLWDRDCSIQRQHQKMIEIAPAPDLAPDLRNSMIDAAITMARKAELVGLATFEFLTDDSGAWYFIECNPRLQVEHTITEEITGIDLVTTQIQLAQGHSLEALGIAPVALPVKTAIQARICAETWDETGQLRPAIGRIDRIDLAAGPGIRIDHALMPGYQPSPGYDTMIAKLIVSGQTADIARRKMTQALQDTTIIGLADNIPLLNTVWQSVQASDTHPTTRWFDQNRHRLLAQVADKKGAVIEDEKADRKTTNDVIIADTDMEIRSPLAGQVLSLKASVGDQVRAGEVLALVEAMKMEHPITAPANGQITALPVAVGDILNQDQVIAALLPQDGAEMSDAEDQAIDPEHIRDDLQALLDRLAKTADAARLAAIDKRHQKGLRSARQNIADLCDPDSFLEYGGLAIPAQRSTGRTADLRDTAPADGIVTGIGTVNSQQFGKEKSGCAIAAVDYTVMAGTQGYFHHKKIDRLLHVANDQGLPVIKFAEGGGGRPNDSDPASLLIAGLNIDSWYLFGKLAGKVPRIAIVAGRCFAGNAAFAGAADLVIATEGSNLGMGGPAMVEGGGLGQFTAEEIGPAETQIRNGVIDVLVKDEAEACQVAKQYLSYFQGPLSDFTAPDPRLLRHALPENRRQIYDMRRVIQGLCDHDSVLELRPHWGIGMITAFGRIEGNAFGIIANNPHHLGGAIDATAADKAADFLTLCNDFGLPVLSLCDTPGFMVGPETEATGQVRRSSKLFNIGAQMRVPLFCLIIRKGYGLGAMAMAGGSFALPVFTLAWPTGEIGAMGVEGAVRLGFKKQLAAIEDPTEREALFQTMVDKVYTRGKALNSAEFLEFDGVIDPADSRQAIMQGLIGWQRQCS